MGCGYEDALDATIVPWDGQQLGRVPAADEDRPMCAGYACGLPEVIEASHAYIFLKNGGLTQATDGEPPSSQLREAVMIIETENARVMEWSSKNPEAR